MTHITTADGRRVRLRLVRPAEPGSSRSRLGLPLLLIHGLGCSGEAWGPALCLLERAALDQPVFAPDMPGYGHSPGEALGIDELADWAARLLDAVGAPRAHVAAHSMGCQVALALARRHPERVGGVILIGPTTGRCPVPWVRYMAGLGLDLFREPLAYNLTLTRMYLQQGVRRYLLTLPKMLADDPMGRAGEVQAPCLVVRGDRDGIVPDAVARKLAAALPRGAFVRVPGAAHAVQFSRPEEFTRIAREFLRPAARVDTAELLRRAAGPSRCEERVAR